jgi:murein L,D-transpeptidase YcbB/YkuD
MAQDQEPHRILVTLAHILSFAVVACWSVAAAQSPEHREELRIAVERIRYAAGASEVDLAAGNLVAEFYERRSFLPAWSDTGKVGSLVTVIEDAFADGLEPADYHMREIADGYSRLQAGATLSPTEWAAFELRLTDALISLVHHQRFGKADPVGQHASWNFRGRGEMPDTLELVEQAISAPSLRESLAALIPRGSYYRTLKVALASYRRIAAEGGWPAMAGGRSLDYGANEERVATLARRLAVTGDLDDAKAYAETTIVDARLQDAVRRFQRRHGLETDGIVGPATIRALNEPVEKRIEQLRLALERARWILDDLGDDFVVVNIAGFRAYVVANRKIVWETRVVVGKAHEQSPVFRDEIQYIVFNPTWTVPYSIATRQMLPEIRQDPRWFESRNFEVKDRSGRLIDPSTVDWSTVTRGNFDYTFVQRPGPDNALGHVKFIFPNEHAVYLHDTPARQLFGSAERAFSHGCIRVENPMDLAEILLAPNGWDRKRIEATVASGKSTTVFLSRPVPILLLYWTANVDPSGLVHFYGDVYQRDARIAKALDGPYRIE